MFKKEILKLLKEYNIKEDSLEIPPNPEMGDFAFPCFILSKTLKKPPVVIAKELETQLKPNKYIQTIKAEGPYLNFFVNKEILNKIILEQIDDNYGNKPKTNKTTLVEFPSPNTNKPLHLGHLRNMALGDSIARILETQGDTIKRVNLNNDRGIHVCKSMLAYKKWGNNKEPNKKSDHFIGDFYVMFSKKLKDNPELEQEAQEMLRKWESKDPETISLWKKMNKWAFQGFKETYKKFGIKFDKEYYESKTYSKGKQIIQENEKKGLFTKDETGATIIDLGEKLGNKVLLRSDGTTVYITQDLYLAQLKHDDFKYHKSIYVVGNEQNYHFEVLFKILKILKYPFADNCYHLSYGMVNLPEGKMKSREGTVVDADDLMDNLQELALKEIQERDIAKTKQDKLAKNISLSALKYYLLKYSAHKDFTFNPKESVSFEGDTGPYIQYTYVRANKILKRMRLNQKNIAYNKLVLPQELNLIKKLADFPMIIEKSAKQLSPHIIAEYTYQLASLFNQFYEHCPVIKEPNVYTLHTRLNVVQAYTKVVKKALNLLGIEVVNEM